MFTRSQKTESKVIGQGERGRALSPLLALPSAGGHLTPGGLPLTMTATTSCLEVADSVRPILVNPNIRGEEGWGGARPKINPLAPVRATSQGVSLSVNVSRSLLQGEDPWGYDSNISTGSLEESSIPPK